MADKWIQKATAKNKGSLRRALGVKEGDTIPASKVNKAIKKGAKDDATVTEQKLAKKARLAKTLKNLNK